MAVVPPVSCRMMPVELLVIDVIEIVFRPPLASVIVPPVVRFVIVSAVPPLSPVPLPG